MIKDLTLNSPTLYLLVYTFPHMIIIIIKWEVCTIGLCLKLGHEIISYAMYVLLHSHGKSVSAILYWCFWLKMFLLNVTYPLLWQMVLHTLSSMQYNSQESCSRSLVELRASQRHLAVCEPSDNRRLIQWGCQVYWLWVRSSWGRIMDTCCLGWDIERHICWQWQE